MASRSHPNCLHRVGGIPRGDTELSPCPVKILSHPTALSPGTHTHPHGAHTSLWGTHPCWTHPRWARSVGDSRGVWGCSSPAPPGSVPCPAGSLGPSPAQSCFTRAEGAQAASAGPPPPAPRAWPGPAGRGLPRSQAAAPGSPCSHTRTRPLTRGGVCCTRTLPPPRHAGEGAAGVSRVPMRSHTRVHRAHGQGAHPWGRECSRGWHPKAGLVPAAVPCCHSWALTKPSVLRETEARGKARLGKDRSHRCPLPTHVVRDQGQAVPQATSQRAPSCLVGAPWGARSPLTPKSKLAVPSLSPPPTTLQKQT